MRRIEMITFIESELKDICGKLPHKSENDHAFFRRNAQGLLDMIEGLGMLPPTEVAPLSLLLSTWDDYE